MWWMLGMLACKAPLEQERSEEGLPAPGTSTQPPFDLGTGQFNGDGLCDIEVVEPGAPAVVLAEPPKHLVVLSIDTLRRDYVDFYTCDEVDRVSRMPFLSSILARSVSFEDVQQCSNWTFPSTNCTLSGQLLEDMDHVPRSGLEGRPVPNGQRTLATLLADAGFFTALVYSNGWFYLAGPDRLPLDERLTGNSQGYQRRSRAVEAFDVVSEGISLLREAMDGPAPPDRWMLHLHFLEPHDLYTAPDDLMPELQELDPIDVDFRNARSFRQGRQGYSGLSEADQQLSRQHFQVRYTGDLRLLDRRLRLVWTRLQDEGLLDDTLVVIWTDHGEAFWERGHQAHGYRLGAEENDAILAFWTPDLQPARVMGPHHAIDFLPTTLSALGLTVPEDLPGVRGGAVSADRPRYAACSNIVNQRYQSVTREGFKLTVGWNGSVTLHDRKVDPTERTDIFSPFHSQVAGLWALLRPRVVALEGKIPEGQQPDWAALEAAFEQ